MKHQALRTVFVTVGTTQFDGLVRKVTSDECLEAFKTLGCERLIVQLGHGQYTPESDCAIGINISWYRFKPNLDEDTSQADLVISHAGAGSVLQTLKFGKKLVVVINESLMNNHQLELAEEFCEKGFLYSSNVDHLDRNLLSFDFGNLKAYVPGQPRDFAVYVEDFLGL